MIRLAHVFAVALAAAPLTGARGEASPAATRVRTIRPGAPDGAALVPASVVAARRATISTRLAAAVRDVHVREGQRVRAGQLLVSLADSDVRGGVAAAESGLAAARAHEQRIRALAAERAATPSELDQAVAQRAQAEAAVAASRATLAYTELRAPFDAIVQARRIDPGDLVGPAQPLVDLEGDVLEVVATLSEGEARGLSLGAGIRFEAGAARGAAIVTALTPGGDALSHRRTVRARVQTIDGGAELRTGAFARLRVPHGAGARGEGLWIPRSALVERGDLTGVFLASGGRAELRWLSLGEAAGDLVLVRAGLRREDAVVDAPGALRDGQAIEVLP